MSDISWFTLGSTIFAALAIAIGHPNPDYVERSEDLHNKVFLAQVGIEEASDPKYGDVNGMQNRILGYKPVPGAAPRPAKAPYQKADHARSAAQDKYNPDEVAF